MVAPAGGVELYQELGRTKLTGTASSVSVSSFDAKPYLMFIFSPIFGDTNAKDCKMGLGATSLDSGSNYARRYRANQGSETTSTSQVPDDVSVIWSSLTATNGFGVYFMTNVSSEQKLMTGWSQSPSSTGAGSVPSRVDFTLKWDNTSDDCQYVEYFRPSYDLSANSELIVLGYDPADTGVTSPWEELYSGDISSNDEFDTGTISAKKYLWMEFEGSASGNSTFARLQFNSDTGSNYCDRNSSNGGGTNTNTNGTSLPAGSNVGSNSTSNEFFTAWMSNLDGQEKLFLDVAQNGYNTGAGNAPSRTHFGNKWASTSQITSVKLYNGESGNWDNAKFRIWGMD
jgi:hypothetical protein